MTVAEGTYGELDHIRTIKLQWGRNLTVAEGSSISAEYVSEMLASMGPQLDSCGRYLAHGRGRGRSASFNGAAT